MIVQSLPIFVLIGLAAPPAHADPIRIVTGGQAVAQMNSGSFTFTGADFSLTGGVPDGFASTIFECTPCMPSDRITLSLSSFTSGHFADGFPGEFAGVTYPATYLFGVFTFTSIDFTSGVLSPTRTAPFTFRGELFNYASPEEGTIGGTPPFFAPLVVTLLVVTPLFVTPLACAGAGSMTAILSG